MPTRYNEIGLAGRAPGSGVQAGIDGSPGRQRDPGMLSDPFLRQYVIELNGNADDAEQATGFTMPANAIGVSGFLRVKVAGGTSVDIGVVASPTVLATALATGVADVIIPLETANIDLSGLELAYDYLAAGAAECELVLMVLASDD